jgi:hypothetical protein
MMARPLRTCRPESEIRAFLIGAGFVHLTPFVSNDLVIFLLSPASTGLNCISILHQ